MKKIYIILLSILLPLIALSIWGFIVLKQDAKNGFNRSFKDGVVTGFKEIESSERLIGYCGVKDEHAYFTTDNPQKIAILNLRTSVLKYEFLSTPSEKWIEYNYSIQLESDRLTLFAGNLPAVFNSKPNSLNTLEKVEFVTKHFNTGILNPTGGYFIREYSADQKDYLVTKINDQGKVIAKEKNVSFLTHDNGMSSQAHLLYSSDYHRLFLIYKLSNQIYCLDTNLQLLYATHSIDTVTTPTIKESIIEEKNGKIGTMNKPPHYTNYAAAVNGEHLFIYSKMNSDNQRKEFNKLTIDVYRIDKGNYEYSFQIPKPTKTGIIALGVYQNQLLSIENSGRRILICDLNLSYNSNLAIN